MSSLEEKGPPWVEGEGQVPTTARALFSVGSDFQPLLCLLALPLKSNSQGLGLGWLSFPRGKKSMFRIRLLMWTSRLVFRFQKLNKSPPTVTTIFCVCLVPPFAGLSFVGA